MSVWTVEKSRLYRPGERYSSGEGFEGSTQDEAQARTWFANFSRRYPSDGDHEWAVELRKDGVVVERVGPPMVDCKRSMTRAYAGWPGAKS